MGVTGLWRLIEPAGKPVPIETLENKVLAVDISIWLHQMVKGYQDARGAPLPNAHLMGLFQRICKLLYFRIKPIFVFDGSYPELKKETIAKRQDSKLKHNTQSAKLKREIALLLGKKTAINSLLGNQISPKKSKPVQDSDDLFKLPALPEKDIESESESEDDEENSSASTVDLHSVDLESDKFQNMPLKEKYDLLIELKETRKMNSWGKIHTLPKKSDNFSDFQMQRLLKRRKLQECLVETEKEIGDGGMSLNELESLLNEEGIDTKIESLANRRIASNNTTRYLLISSVKQAIADAKKKEMEALEQPKNQPGKSTDDSEISPKKDELEDDLQKAIKMSLECVNEAETSVNTSKTDDSWTSHLTDTDYSDCEDDDGYEPPDMTSAKAYIKQYSDFTSKAIDDIVASKTKGKNKDKEPKVDEILEDLNKEKSIIKDNIELTSSDEDIIEIEDKSLNKIEPSKEVQILGNEIAVSRQLNSNEDADIGMKEKITNKNDDIHVNMHDTQASVVCVENSMEDIISLESSIDNVDEINFPRISKENSNMIHESSIQSETSDDDFEDVSDSEISPKKPVIELTLEMGKEVEDDIFADIFQGKVMVNNINQSTPTHADKKEVKRYMQKNIPNYNQYENNMNLNITEHSNESKFDKNVKPTSEILNKEPDIKVIDSKSQNIVLHKSSTKIECTDSNFPTLEAKAKDEQQVPGPSSKNDCTNASSTLDANNKESILIAKNKDSNLELKTKEPISIEELNTLMTEIETEKDELLQEKGRLDRIGRNITETMTKEAQELLQVFGIPYIVAPMEAEAQCAFLESVKLTDGTITDDSDIWLFGGRTVYKNFFNQKKHVLQFLSERIEKSFNLTREQLVLLALLVGSDYTTGVTGVGPVTALEILASFPFNKKKMVSESSKHAQYQELVNGLQEFKKWVKAGQRTDNVSLKKKLKNVSLSDEFPSVRVVHAYLEPNVEKNEENFTWGEIDLTILRDYAKTKFGWSQNKLDEIIKPVLKRMLDHKSQKSIYDFFKRKIEFQSLEDQMSKRVKEAVQRMGPEGCSVEEIPGETDMKKPKKRKTKVANEAVKAKEAKKMNEIENIAQVVKTAVLKESETSIEINVPKSSRVQEIIPQREHDKKSLLENKLKAIEIYRKTKIDCKKKLTKRKLPVPKEKAELSESDSD